MPNATALFGIPNLFWGTSTKPEGLINAGCDQVRRIEKLQARLFVVEGIVLTTRVRPFVCQPQAFGDALLRTRSSLRLLICNVSVHEFPDRGCLLKAGSRKICGIIGWCMCTYYQTMPREESHHMSALRFFLRIKGQHITMY